MKKIRTACFRTVKKIIKEQHGGDAVIFLSVGGYWGTKVKKISNWDTNAAQAAYKDDNLPRVV